MLNGIVASSGIGIGTAIVVQQLDLIVQRSHGNPKIEKKRFDRAVVSFTEEINNASEVIGRMAGPDEAEILRTQIAFVNDPDLREALDETLDRERVNLEYAFCKVCDRFIDVFASIGDDLFRTRSSDLRDLKIHMLSIMMGLQKVDLSTIPYGSIVVSNDLLPSSTATIDPSRIRGIVTQDGATCSHLSMISRALALPTLVAVDGLLEHVKDGDTLIVDGEEGNIVRNPTPNLLASYRDKYALPF